MIPQSNRPENQAKARLKGAFGSTNDPRILFELVIMALSLPSIR